MPFLCRLSELADVAARGFDPGLPHCSHGIVVVRHDGEFLGYLNQCPHRGLPLNWLPDRFLDTTGKYLQCANHDALFEIADGFCVAGPCAGACLVPVRLVMRGAELWLDEPAIVAD
ncbi:MAG: Rieske 2Fe-2S domain-containing protein [Gammaproteobacteria bacterium]|nr:Rieske 2Fe-2S domain-containing protein [Gammaproteobacteria bacterium]